jgi:hypothetical protein
MKTCNYCGGENPNDAALCTGCGMELEAAASGGMKLTEDLAVLATFADATEASLLVGRLAQAGIEACIPEELEGVFGNVTSLSHITVRVGEKDLAAAKEVLAG